MGSFGVTIRCRKDGDEIYIPSNGFRYIRSLAAEQESKLFCEHFEQFLKLPPAGKKREAFLAEFDKTTETMLQKGRFSKQIVEFCLQSAESGKIGTRTCRYILALLENIEDCEELVLCYHGGQPREVRMKDFFRVLREGIKTRSGVEWF